MHKKPNLTTDDTDNTDLHGSKKFAWSNCCPWMNRHPEIRLTKRARMGTRKRGARLRLSGWWH